MKTTLIVLIALFTGLAFAQGKSRTPRAADVIVPLAVGGAVGYVAGRATAPNAPPPTIAPMPAQSTKCFIQIGAITVDARQITSVAHQYIGYKGHSCMKDEYHNVVGLANGQIVSSCTAGSVQNQVFRDIQGCNK